MTAWVSEAAGNGAKILLFPEYGAMELASIAQVDPGDLDAAAAVSRTEQGGSIGERRGRHDIWEHLDSPYPFLKGRRGFFQRPA